MPRLNRPGWPTRLVAVALAVLGIPAVLSISSLLQDEPVREGEPAPRTIVAPEPITVDDPDGTRRARNNAAAAVDPVLVDDDEARAAIVEQVRDSFADIDDVRASLPEGDPDQRDQQVEVLTERVPSLGTDGAERALELTDTEFERTTTQAEDVAISLAGGEITEERLEDVRNRRLGSELATRRFPAGVADSIVEPIVSDALQPTVLEDPEATEEAREEARDEVADVQRSFTRGSEIVTAGETVDELQMAALRQAGLDGAEPWRFFAQALLLTAALVAVAALYLRVYRRKVWASPRRLLLLAVLGSSYAVVLEGVTLVVPTGQSAWLFVLPVGAVSMLATILVDPPIGVLSTVPTAALTAFAMPGEPAVVVFVALAALGSVPLVSRLSARGDLRRAAVHSTLGYAVLAAVAVAAFDQPDLVPLAAGAGLLGGVATAIIVNGSLPFLESAFGMLTATSLLDLADRNHPMLRELEQKSLGTYNHSIMVSQMTERACRAVGADGLLGSVAALYHDIGKTRRPYFFVENQFGIANPHDELEPHESAKIIREHVPNGVEFGRRHRLPPEIVEGIACHHGTTLVSYFYRQACAHAADPDDVDETDYRYPGPKPASKEFAVLMLADCCESAARATALTNRNLSREDLVNIVYTLTGDRVEDGQLDESALTFRDLAVVQESFIETLVGVYHPRIAYPESHPAAGEGNEADEAADADGDATVPVAPADVHDDVQRALGGSSAADQPADGSPRGRGAAAGRS